MKILFMLLMGGLAIHSWAQDSAVAWNTVMTGTIGKYPATIYLQKTGKGFNGYYYYDNKQIPMRLMDAGVSGDSVHLAVYDNDMEETFDGIIESNLFKGSWNNTQTGKPATKLEFNFAVKEPLPVSFDVIYTDYNTEFSLGKEAENNPSYTYFSAALWPSPGTAPALAAFLRNWVNKQFGNKNPLDPIGKFFIKEKNNGSSKWKKDLKAEKLSVIKEMPSGYSYGLERRLLLFYQSERYLSVSDFIYEFTGGAHGNGGSSMSVLNLKKMKSLKLADVVTPAGRQKLVSLLEAAARTRFKIPKGKKLNDPEFGALMIVKLEPTENFYITGKGIGFNYVPYEIAAYAYGETNLFITWEQLKGFLQPSFLATMP